ncbi:MAG: AAA family ATPase, partial [Candidatus Krumholzibacteria bacterium]|nr:AAA family ATPase [Candidatus Krumholzibacteria bacterium]
MLSELRIRNLAVVEDAVIPFGGGLNVLTGSTGAGKSIILTAVELLSGSRARRSLLRSGAGSLTVEGVFEVPADWPLRECLGMGSSDDCLSIKRELAAGGKSRIWINGMLSTNNAAREAVRSLLELHGQHRQQELLDQSNHILYLDAWGDYKDVLGKCMEMIERYRNLYGRMGDLLEKSKRHREEEDFLRFQLSELEGLNLEPDLDRKIERRIKLMENIHRYISGLEESRALLNEEDGSVLEKLGRA